MSEHLTVKKLLLLVLLSGLAPSLVAQGVAPNRDAKGNLVPTPRGEACIESAETMRREHMNFLLHKRDLTMRQGIRTSRASLVECIDCHVTPDSSGKVARINDEKHFCSSCHVAASVSIDCFDCHADRPVELMTQ